MLFILQTLHTTLLGIPAVSERLPRFVVPISAKMARATASCRRARVRLLLIPLDR